MAWTTRIIRVDLNTGEVLDTKILHKYTLIDKQKLYTKINDGHTERIIIERYAESSQRRLFD